jgi:hypothetical protein
MWLKVGHEAARKKLEQQLAQPWDSVDSFTKPAKEHLLTYHDGTPGKLRS